MANNGNDKDPLEFSKAVSVWIAEARGKIDEFRQQVGTPTLAIDAGIVSSLTQVDGILAQAGADLSTQLPVEEEPAK
jgi:hypothetical protein